MSFFKKCVVQIMCFSFILLAACGVETASDKKVKNIDFTVVNEEDIPETLMNAIEEKKSAPFKLSYCDDKEQYLVVGYGEQKSGGYSILVDGLYTTENTIVFATTLKGPEANEGVTEAVSYPYIVVKMEYIEYEVVFE